MKKTALYLIVFTVLALFLSSCANISDDKKLAVYGSLTVPGMFSHDLKGSSYTCNVIEEDNYGRILFFYEANSVFTENLERAYVICQKADSSSVFYYEDICYIIATEEAADINKLKALNDWNMPINEQRMSKREFKISYDLYIVTESKLDYNSARKACCEALDIQQAQINTFTTLDANQGGQELFWLSIEQNGAKETYYVLMDLEYSAICFHVAHSSPELIQTFKQENGWIYREQKKTGDGSLS